LKQGIFMENEKNNEMFWFEVGFINKDSFDEFYSLFRTLIMNDDGLEVRGNAVHIFESDFRKLYVLLHKNDVNDILMLLGNYNFKEINQPFNIYKLP
jgi:hypothetical protein